MNTDGARAELIRELRRIGPKCTDAAEYLGVTVITLPQLPAGASFIVLAEQCVLLAVSGSDWAIWGGLAVLLANELGLEVDEGTIYEVAVAVDRRSGIFLAQEIA